MPKSLSTPSKRSAPTNGIQKNMLIEYMEQNPKLRAGTFSPDFTFKNCQTLWEIITVKLNAVPGGAKKDDWRMWRKTWADMKKNATRKAVRLKKESQKTGGGTPPKSDLNEDDIMILDMINTKKV
ncbi:unnamed protein product [Brassicogethes aeneus]|uniref:Regulatory protein zeste n=1 Tax=Brassicogethes aeneus TaxID=1431903 RepID=A0A9P0BGZ0_BRAAE|nr:unnamed protein product [Brassicogethes aeneus]